jgi:hypothetical protein|tara:strand:+ start:150 stop:302 length:153 start_codon:yes stop_codon:yes gene_type:complete
MSNKEIMSSLEFIAEQLKGTLNHYTTLDSMGRQSKKIVIEYDIKQKENNA